MKSFVSADLVVEHVNSIGRVNFPRHFGPGWSGHEEISSLSHNFIKQSRQSCVTWLRGSKKSPMGKENLRNGEQVVWMS